MNTTFVETGCNVSRRQPVERTITESLGVPQQSTTRSKAGEIRIGISGWRYPPWRGTFDVKVKAPRDARALADKIHAAGGNIVVPHATFDAKLTSRSTTRVARTTASERGRTSWPDVGTR